MKIEIALTELSKGFIDIDVWEESYKKERKIVKRKKERKKEEEREAENFVGGLVGWCFMVYHVGHLMANPPYIYIICKRIFYRSLSLKEVFQLICLHSVK